MKYIVSDMTLHPVSETDLNNVTFYFNRDIYDSNKDLKKDFASVVLISDDPKALIDFIYENKHLQENFDPATRTGFAVK